MVFFRLSEAKLDDGELEKAENQKHHAKVAGANMSSAAERQQNQDDSQPRLYK